MAELVSPGVQVSITDESFYASAGTGTVPFILIATAQDKSAPDGSGQRLTASQSWLELAAGSGLLSGGCFRALGTARRASRS